jgi:hypothetical protein
MMLEKSPRRGLDEGAVAVEAGITMSALLLLILGIIQFGLSYWTWNTMLLAVEEAGRYAMLFHSYPSGPPGCTNGSLAACAVNWANTQNLGSNFTITSSVPTAGSLRFTASYTFNIITPITLQRQITVPII